MASKLWVLGVALIFSFVDAIVDNDISCSLDLSRKGCSNPTSGLPLPVYVYPPPFEYQPQQVHPHLQHMLIWLSKSKGKEAIQVYNPDEACLFLVTSPIVALCNNEYNEFWKDDTLSHWNLGGSGSDGGMNHIIYMPRHTDWEVTNYPTGKAMLLRSASTERSFWPEVDSQVPFYTPVCNNTERQSCVKEQQVEGRGPSFLPEWVEEIIKKEKLGTPRSLLGGFIGAIRLAGPFVVPAADLTVGNRLRVALTCLHSIERGFVVADTNDKYDLSRHFDLLPDPGRNGHVWKDYYWRVLLNSHYALCPSGAGAHSQRLNEAIAAGSVPVVFNDDVSILPFSEYPEAAELWEKCVIRFDSEHQIKDVISILENHLYNRIQLPGDIPGGINQWKERQRNCRLLHNQFFSSHDQIIESTFQSINFRIKHSLPSRCVWQRPLAVDLEGFNGMLLQEDTPFPARERTALLSYARDLHAPRFKQWSVSDAEDTVGTYQEGLLCLQSQWLSRYGDGQEIGVEKEDLMRKMMVELSLAEESAMLFQYKRANSAYQQCRKAYDGYVDLATSDEQKMRDGRDTIPGREWMVAAGAWCDYVSGLLAELEAEQASDVAASSSLIDKAVMLYRRAMLTYAYEAPTWDTLRGGKISQFVQDNLHRVSLTDFDLLPKTEVDLQELKLLGWAVEESSVMQSVEVQAQSKLSSPELPLVRMSLDPVSWLAWEFNHEEVRSCSKSKCQVQVGNMARKNSIGEFSVYLTSFGGRPDNVYLPSKSSNHVNAVVFMENDARLFPDGRRGFSLALNQSILPKLDLGLGYRPSPPWDTHVNSHGIPWRQFSYINDPVENFKKWQQYGEGTRPITDDLIPGVVFFSSQCDPAMAAARLTLIKPLMAALEAQNIRFASFGKCFHTEDLENTLPQCANLQRQTVDHDAAKSCALSHFAFTLAIENSEDDGYATEKIWQPLLASSVPIYWGAPEIKSMLPNPSAAIHIRDFNGSMSRLAAYLKYLLENKEEYEKHRAWKRQGVESWSPTFMKMISNRKKNVFCAVCDYAVSHAVSSVYSDDEVDDVILGFFTLNVVTEQGSLEHRIDIPDYEGERLISYCHKVCLEVGTDGVGCQAIVNEIARLQTSLKT